MEATLIGIGIGLGINIIVCAYSYGKVAQKVDNLHKQINNGFTCKQHPKITDRLGYLEGKAWDGQERRKILTKENSNDG